MQDQRVPVMCGLRCIERADASRVHRLAAAPNAQAIRRRRDGKLVEIQLRAAGDDSNLKGRTGNPRRYSHDLETRDNPARVWALKTIHADAADIFRAVMNDCAKAA
jgi:hypothetical protein